jgi:hypothetical protein
MARLVHLPTGRECRLDVRGRTFTTVTRTLRYSAPGLRPKTELQVVGSAGEAAALEGAAVRRMLEEGWCEVTGARELVEQLGTLEPWATGLRVAREPSALMEAWKGLGEEPLLRALVERVTRVEVGEGGLELSLGAHTLSVAWPLHPELLARVPTGLRPLLSVTGALWLDEDRVMAGLDFGPPEEDATLDGTGLEGAEVTWFLTVGTERFWLVEGERLFRYELEGGLSEEPGARAAARVLEEVLAGTKVPSGGTSPGQGA